jgi:hypothetical protein
MWFNGYWWWVAPTGQLTTPRKCALWSMKSASTGTVIPGSIVTSGTLTAGQWNFIALPTPIPITIGDSLIAAIGVNGNFPDSDTGTDPPNSYGTGGHTAGITNGPLVAFSDQGGTKIPPYGTNQGLFSTAGSDPSISMPQQQSNSGNFWVDVSVSDTAPGGYTGSYRLWPNMAGAYPGNQVDTSVNYTLACEFALSAACNVNKIWYYSYPGSAQLATDVNIWTMTGGGLTGTSIFHASGLTWSGAAGSGWISTTISGASLSAGSCKVSVYNGAATPDGWSGKLLNYWDTGVGANGIVNGPISAPKKSASSLAYDYNGANGGATPPFSAGTTESGQNTFAQGPPNQYPYLFVASIAQMYYVDIEVTPVVVVNGTASVAFGALSIAATGSVVVTGTGNVAFGVLSINATGVITVKGTATVAFGALSITAAGVSGGQGMANIVFGALAITAVGTVISNDVSGTATIAFGGLDIHALGAPQGTVMGTAAIVFGALLIQVVVGGGELTYAFMQVGKSTNSRLEITRVEVP